MTIKLHDGAEGKIFGSVLYFSGRFHPQIVVSIEPHGFEDVLWRGDWTWGIETARLALAEAVALTGLCFWPPSHLNDNGRELGVSPWMNSQVCRAYENGQLVHGVLCSIQTDNPSPRCPWCRNEIDPTICWCGSEIPHDAYNDGHGAIPMGCDCGRMLVPR